jgi:hypothetical protein
MTSFSQGRSLQRLTQGDREKKRTEMTHYVPYILVHMPHELKLGYVTFYLT